MWEEGWSSPVAIAARPSGGAYEDRECGSLKIEGAESHRGSHAIVRISETHVVIDDLLSHSSTSDRQRTKTLENRRLTYDWGCQVDRSFD